MKENFNVATPTKENIDYAFKNLIYYANSCIELEEYSNYKDEFKKVLYKINKLLSIYVNKNDIELISDNDLNEIKLDLIDLDVETQKLNSRFAGYLLIWIEAIISLKMMKKKRGKNA